MADQQDTAPSISTTNSLTAAAAKAILEDQDGVSKRVTNLLSLIETVQKGGVESAAQLERLGGVQAEIVNMSGGAPGSPEPGSSRESSSRSKSGKKSG